jgi:hypothetical protein
MNSTLEQHIKLSLGGDGVRLPPADRKVSPVEIAKAFRLEQGNGTTTKELCTTFSISTKMVSLFLRLLELPADIQSFVSWGRAKSNWVGFSVAAELARCKTEHQSLLFAESMKFGLSKAEVVSVKQLEERSNSTIDQALQRVLGRRAVIIHKELWIAHLREDILALTDNLLQHERDAALHKALVCLNLETIAGKLGDVSVALLGEQLLRDKLQCSTFKDTLMSALYTTLSLSKR